MKSIFSMIAVVAALATGSAWGASTHWATVNTVGCGSDVEAGLANSEFYTAYLLAQVEAEERFDGASTQKAITAYLAANCPHKALSDCTELTMKEYGLGQYSFSDFFAEPFEGTYFAVVTYVNGDDKKFLVFSEEAEGGNLLFEDGGSLRTWSTCDAVPEPNSCLLVLVGSVLLSLRRNRRTILKCAS